MTIMEIIIAQKENMAQDGQVLQFLNRMQEKLRTELIQ